MEGFYLFHQLISKFLAGDFRVAGDVVNWFFGVKLCALAAGAVEDVDEMAFHIQQAKFESAEQAAGACTYDNGIGGYCVFLRGRGFGVCQSLYPCVVLCCVFVFSAVFILLSI